MNEINWGIIGTGNIANSFAKDFPYSEGSRLIAVASRTLENANDFGEKFKVKNIYGSYAELFADPEVDVVYIATPHSLHFENALDALNIGKAVLCEKPITVNQMECEKLTRLAASTNTYLMEAMWMYFLPSILKMKEWIMEDKIGKVLKVNANFGFKVKFDAESRLFNPDLAGGALLDIGIYPIALAWLLTEQLPTKVSVNAKMASTGVDTDEQMIFEYEDGLVANLSASLLRDLHNDALIVGEKGTIKIPDFFRAKECYLYDQQGVITDHFLDNRKSIGYNYEIDAVNKDLRSGKKQSVTMPLQFSSNLQKIMAMVLEKF